MFLDFNSPAGSTPIAENGAEFVNIFKTFQVKTADGHYLPAYYTPIPLGRDFASYLENNPGGLWVISNEVDRGQQQKPLILTEFSILYPYLDEGATCFIQDEYGNCFTPDRVSNFMKASFNYLNNRKNKDLSYALDENRLVQQWTWFSLHTNSVSVGSNILEPDRQNLTQIGKAFKQEIFAQPQVMNLLVDDIPKVVAVIDQSGKANVSLSVKFRNNGNTAINKPFTVTFYSDQGLNNKIGSTVVSDMIRGCTTHDYEALVKWTDLPAGRHRFWVLVDDGNAIVEGPPQQQDNMGTGLVLISKKATTSQYLDEVILFLSLICA